jgi:hypothetical protein
MFSKTAEISNSIKIRPVAAKVFHADRQTDMTKIMVAYRNIANASLTVIFLNLNIYQCCVGTAAITPFTFIFISFTLLSSLQLSSVSILTADYTQQPFFLSRKDRFGISARRPSIVEAARLSSGTPHHSSLSLSATSFSVRYHSAVKPLSLLHLQTEGLYM